MTDNFRAKLGMLKVGIILVLVSVGTGCGATVEDNNQVIGNSSHIEQELGGPIESLANSGLPSTPETENKNCTPCGGSSLCHDRNLRRCCTIRNGHYYDCGCTPERC